MQTLPPAIEVYPVHHLPILKAYADQLGLVSLINHYVPTEMAVDAGTVVLALVLATLRGRSPLYRLEEFFAPHDTALLLGKAVPPQALHDDTAGRVLGRVYLHDGGGLRDCRQARCPPRHLVPHPPPRHLPRMWTGHGGGRRSQRLGGGRGAGPDATNEAPAGDLLSSRRGA